MLIQNIGKVLIFVNLTLSFLFLGWAWGLYTERIQYASVQSDGQEIPGKIKELQDRIERLTRQRDASENRWRSAYAAIVNAENLRYQYLEWYGDLRYILEKGTDKDGKPVKVLALAEDKDGKLIMNRGQLKPVMIGKEEAEGLRIYEDRFDQVKKQIEAANAQIDQLIKEQRVLTDEINGVPGKTVGLRNLLALEDLAVKRSKDEQERLKPMLYNSQAEAELIVKRNNELKSRLKELGGVVAADRK